MQIWAALEQETFLGLFGPHPKRLLAPSNIDQGEIQEFGPCARQSDPNPRTHFLSTNVSESSPFFAHPLSVNCPGALSRVMAFLVCGEASFFLHLQWTFVAYSALRRCDAKPLPL